MTEKFDPELTGLVVTDPQNDFLSPKGVFWDAVKASVIENNTIPGTPPKAQGFS